MSARFAREVGQCFGVDGFIEEREAGGAEKAVALCVDFSHQHVVLAWRRDRMRECVRICQIPGHTPEEMDGL